MKKGDICQGRIDRVDFPNKGKVMLPDTTVTVKNGIPGQKIEFVINKKRGGRLEGRLLKVLEKSPLETRACLQYLSCLRRLYVPDDVLRRSAPDEIPAGKRSAG